MVSKRRYQVPRDSLLRSPQHVVGCRGSDRSHVTIQPFKPRLGRVLALLQCAVALAAPFKLHAQLAATATATASTSTSSLRKSRTRTT